MKTKKLVISKQTVANLQRTEMRMLGGATATCGEVSCLCLSEPWFATCDTENWCTTVVPQQ